ncbi:protein SON isoform X1 [Carassius gibelio]|uniref:protein SON isoform X1 n=1 Tax=Carassius gibelio TaxID=101364 RepID=UPI0022786BCC|nr:protein SON isoform X1 [Carassius gibelio]
METEIEHIFRDFLMNKIKEIEDETQETSVKDEPQSDPVKETREDGHKEEQMNTLTDNVVHTDLQDNHGQEDTSTKHRKSKKHKKHKSKKKRKKRKEGKDSSSDTESDKEIQESGKKKKSKKKKRSKDADKPKRSGSRSESSSASGSESESESKPSKENTKSSSADKTSKSELRDTSGVGKPQELPDIIPKVENSVHKSTEMERTEEKKRSSCRTSKSKERSRGRRTRSRSPRRKSERRSRSPKRKPPTSRSRNSSKKRSPQQRERSRSRSKRHNNRSRSHSVRRGKHSRSRSRSRSRSVVISRKNRRSTSKSRSRSPQHRHHSRSKSQSRTKPSESRSISNSRSDLKLETELITKDIDPAVDNSKSCETQTNVSLNTTENGKDPTVTVISDTKLSETASNVSSSGFSPVVVKGSWRPIPFLAQPSETTSSQKCVKPEVPLEVTNISEEPSVFPTVKPKDSEGAASPEKKETNVNPTTIEETSVEKNSMSPSRSPSQKISASSKVAAQSGSKSSSKKKSRSSSQKSRSPSERKSHKSRPMSKHSKSRSPKKKRSRSRSQGRQRKSRTPDRNRRSKSRKRSSSRSRRRSRSGSRQRRAFGSRTLNQRDRWKREPSRSPVLILRNKRSTSKTRRSTSKTPPRLTELDKEQLLEIAKANAAAMCAKAGMQIPESLRPRAALQLPLPIPNSTSLSLSFPMMSNMTMNAAMASMTAATMTAALSSMGALAFLPQMAPLPTIVNKPPSSNTQNLANIEEAKKKVAKQANSFSIKELTERCKKIVDSKEEMAIAKPHVSDDEEDERPFGASLKEHKGIAFSLSNTSIKPSIRTDVTFAKEFPVSSGSQHRNKEPDGAYGEWVSVKKKTEKPSASGSSGTEKTTKDNDSVFPEAPSQPVDITSAVSERAVAQKRLAENPFDINAMCMLNKAQEQVDAWAQSNTIPGLFTGSTGAQVLSSDELSNSGPQAWIKKDQFLRAAPVSGGMGELLMRKMGWHSGEGLGKHREGTVEPIIIDFKTDRKGLVAEGEKTQKSGNIVVMKDLLGKHPVSALMEMCNKKKWPQPEFVLVHHSGPDHRKNFLFKVVVNGCEYQPQTASSNKKHAKAVAATVALQAMGEVAGDSVHTGPVFTAATST